jgi:hypothetical protein
MADVLIFDPHSTPVPNRGIELRRSVHTPDYENRADAIINPVLPEGVPLRHLKVSGGLVLEMSQEEKDSMAAADLATSAASQTAETKNLFDRDSIEGRLVRALLEVLRDEINSVRAVPIVGLGARTKAELRVALRNKIDGQA